MLEKTATNLVDGGRRARKRRVEVVFSGWRKKRERERVCVCVVVEERSGGLRLKWEGSFVNLHYC